MFWEGLSLGMLGSLAQSVFTCEVHTHTTWWALTVTSVGGHRTQCCSSLDCLLITQCAGGQVNEDCFSVFKTTDFFLHWEEVHGAVARWLYLVKKGHCYRNSNTISFIFLERTKKFFAIKKVKSFFFYLPLKFSLLNFLIHLGFILLYDEMRRFKLTHPLIVKAVFQHHLLKNSSIHNYIYICINYNT